MKPLLLFVLICLALHSSAQRLLVVQKKRKRVDTYWTGNIIAFQTKDGQWQKGEITYIGSDSFYVKPYVVQYSMFGADTFHFGIVRYAVKDIYALPNKGILIDFKDGRYQIAPNGGHVHFYWIKSGWLFRTGALGYAALNISNSIIDKDLSFKNNKKPLAIATGVFLGGVLLHKHYKPALRVNKRFRVEVLQL